MKTIFLGRLPPHTPLLFIWGGWLSRHCVLKQLHPKGFFSILHLQTPEVVDLLLFYNKSSWEAAAERPFVFFDFSSYICLITRLLAWRTRGSAPSAQWKITKMRFYRHVESVNEPGDDRQSNIYWMWSLSPVCPQGKLSRRPVKDCTENCIKTLRRWWDSGGEAQGRVDETGADWLKEQWWGWWFSSGVRRKTGWRTGGKQRANTQQNPPKNKKNQTGL